MAMHFYSAFFVFGFFLKFLSAVPINLDELVVAEPTAALEAHFNHEIINVENNYHPDEVHAEPEVGHAAAEPEVGYAVAEPEVGYAVAEPEVGHAAAEPEVGHAAAEPEVGHSADELEEVYAADEPEKVDAADEQEVFYTKEEYTTELKPEVPYTEECVIDPTAEPEVYDAEGKSADDAEVLYAEEPAAGPTIKPEVPYTEQKSTDEPKTETMTGSTINTEYTDSPHAEPFTSFHNY